MRLTLLILFLIIYIIPFAQQTRKQLEEERNGIKNEIQEAERILALNQKNAKQNITQLSLIERKVELQGSLISTLDNDLNILDYDINKAFKETSRLETLLDTLKNSYARSMRFAYKNRSNFDFLNFLFSSNSFNDAVKRITYLKQYHKYREKQGQNILNTKNILKDRIGVLNGTKEDKRNVIDLQSNELMTLQSQQESKNILLAQLKAQGNDLTAQLDNKRRQIVELNNTIARAIKKARDEAIAKAKIAAAEKTRMINEERKRRETERLAAIAEQKRLNAIKGAAKTPAVTIASPKANKSKTGSGISKSNAPSVNLPDITIETKEPPIVSTIPKVGAVKNNPTVAPTEIFNDAPTVQTSRTFEQSKGYAAWPVDGGYLFRKMGPYKIDNVTFINSGITIAANIGAPVKSISDGFISSITPMDDRLIIIVQSGKYLIVYSNVTAAQVKMGQTVTVGQMLAKVSANDDNNGEIDLIINDANGKTYNPETWLRRK